MLIFYAPFTSNIQERSISKTSDIMIFQKYHLMWLYYSYVESCISLNVKYLLIITCIFLFTISNMTILFTILIQCSRNLQPSKSRCFVNNHWYWDSDSAYISLIWCSERCLIKILDVIDQKVLYYVDLYS